MQQNRTVNNYAAVAHGKINGGVKQGCTHSTQACSVKGFKMRGLRGFSEGGGTRLSVTSKHTKLFSFFFFPPLPLFLLSLTITAALEAELLNCSKMSELQSSLE